MTQPPGPPPVSYYTPYGPSYPPPNPRPTSVTVLAIIGIILGGFGVLCTPISMVFYFTDFGMEAFQTGYTGVALVAHIIYDSVNWVLSLVLLICCVGALRLDSWGRTGMMVVAIAWLIMLPVWITMFILWEDLDITAEGIGPMEMLIGGLVVGGCVLLLSILYPVFVLYFMTRPHVKAAFEVPPDGGESVPYASPYQPPGPP